MNGTIEIKAKADSLKWWAFGFLLVFGIVGNLYFAQINWAVRAATWVVLLIMLAAIAYQTAKGKAAWEFAQQSWIELQKVVWPTREETIRVTMAVVAIVVVVSLILWGIDSILLVIMGLLTGQRG